MTCSKAEEVDLMIDEVEEIEVTGAVAVAEIEEAVAVVEIEEVGAVVVAEDNTANAGRSIKHFFKFSTI